MIVNTGHPGSEADIAADALAAGAEVLFPSPEARRRSDWLEGGLALLDSSRRVVHANGELLNWLGITQEQALGASLESLLQQSCQGIEAVLGRAWSEAAPAAEFQFQMLPPSQNQWLRLETAHNSGGWFVRLSSTLPSLRDLLEDGGGHRGEDPEKQHLRLRLLRAETQLEKLIQRWPGVLFSQRADFSFQYVNSKIEELTGVPPDAWRNQPRRFWDVVHEADVEEFKRQCGQAAQTPAGVTTTYRIRHAITGKVSYVLEHRQAAVSKSGAVLGYDGFWLDITRQTIAEKRLSTAAWKETLALLTIGLAHDFSNIMSGILSLTELILSQTSAEDQHSPTLNMIKQSSLQASQLVQRIVSLHRSKTGVRQYLDLNQVVPDLVELVGKVLPRRIRIETELPPGQLPVYMDAVEFRQVVLNLALNAADAMPNRGVLVFRVAAHTTARELSHFQGRFPRLPCVSLSVQDNGSGIAARHLPHLFDPFFTTKPLTKGSGLGLYNARVFVGEHGGAISVESAEGAGACFHLWLPQADFTEAERMAAEQAERRRSLLLIGQPGFSTDSITEFLRTHNFSVVTTHTPGRATELLASEENNLHGIMVLAEPGDTTLLNLIPELRERWPAKPIVLQIIGGTADQVENRVQEKADLVLASDAEESAFLKRLDALFTAGPTL
jgi:PAS domain S-box-containing protein